MRNTITYGLSVLVLASSGAFAHANEPFTNDEPKAAIDELRSKFPGEGSNVEITNAKLILQLEIIAAARQDLSISELLGGAGRLVDAYRTWLYTFPDAWDGGWDSEATNKDLVEVLNERFLEILNAALKAQPEENRVKFKRLVAATLPPQVIFLNKAKFGSVTVAPANARFVRQAILDLSKRTFADCPNMLAGQS